MIKATTKSWRSTVLGGVAGLMILLSQGQAFLDDDPETTVDYEQIIAALAVFGIGASARDHGVTSEKAGCKGV